MSNIFPKGFNQVPMLIGVGAVIGLLLIGSGIYCTGKYTRVGYEPQQPVSFSHALHVQQLGMDCRFCHTSAEVSARAGLPSTQTCIGCHGEGRILSGSPRLAPVLESWNSRLPIPWVQVHQLPDYVYFNHAAHVHRGVDCVSCHGNVGQMEAVRDVKPLTMAWCLQCHRDPEKFLYPPERSLDVCPFPQKEGKLSPPVSCGGCHR
jgi:cytochrome c7-like protein